jgi:hypothetical protein
MIRARQRIASLGMDGGTGVGAELDEPDVEAGGGGTVSAHRTRAGHSRLCITQSAFWHAFIDARGQTLTGVLGWR